MRRSTRAVAVALAAALALGACGGDGGGKEVATATTAPADGGGRTGGSPLGVDALATAAERTKAATSARVAFSLAMEISGVPDAPAGPLRLSGEGVFDYQARRGSMTMDLSDLAKAGEQLPFEGERFEIVVVGDTAYMKVPEGVDAGGKHWARFDAASALGGLGAFAGGIDQFTNPESSLEMLDGLDPENATVVGTERLRGDEVTHYRVETAAPDTTGSSVPAGLESMLGMFSGVPVDVWLDHDGRMRKLSFELDMAEFVKAFAGALAGAQGSTGETIPPDLSFTMSMTVESWDYGVKVDVQAPPPDDVVDGSTLDREGVPG